MAEHPAVVTAPRGDGIQAMSRHRRVPGSTPGGGTTLKTQLQPALIPLRAWVRPLFNLNQPGPLKEHRGMPLEEEDSVPGTKDHPLHERPIPGMHADVHPPLHDVEHLVPVSPLLIHCDGRGMNMGWARARDLSVRGTVPLSSKSALTTMARSLPSPSTYSTALTTKHSLRP